VTGRFKVREIRTDSVDHAAVNNPHARTSRGLQTDARRQAHPDRHDGRISLNLLTRDGIDRYRIFKFGRVKFRARRTGNEKEQA
jgi:hypothetical protein